MKKTLFIIVALATIACSKIEQPTAMQTVTFKVGDITSGLMDTKATVTEFLRGVQPIGTPTLCVESTTNRSFSIEINAGESIELPIGTYNVTARYRKSIIGNVGGYYVSEEPMYSVNETVEVKAGVKTYFLTGIYECWALIINYTDTDHYMMDGNTFNMVKGDENRKGVLFVSTTEPGINWSLIAYPKDAVNYQTATFTVGENQAGMWYCYSPTQKEKQMGVFGVNLPDWIEAQ